MPQPQVADDADGGFEADSTELRSTYPHEAPSSPYYPVGDLHASQAPGELGGSDYVAELGPSQRDELLSNYQGQERH